MDEYVFLTNMATPAVILEPNDSIALKFVAQLLQLNSSPESLFFVSRGELGKVYLCD
jgi:hypothetical protein